MRCPILSELPPPPSGKTGWPFDRAQNRPWAEEGLQLSDTLPDPPPGTGQEASPWPRVSIVTPSYNQGQFIEETIRSVLLQGYPNLEYIIIDGGSTDGSVDIIRKYEKWLAYWVSEPDKGQSDAINRGWRMATGEIVAYLNSDDVYCPHAIQTAVEFLVKNPQIAMVYGNAYYIDDQGVLLRYCKGGGPDFLFKMLCRELEIVQPTVFMRARAVHIVGMLDVNLHYAMDHDLWIKIGSRFQVGHIPVALAITRTHSSAKSTAQATRSADEAILVRERFFSQERSSVLPSISRRAVFGSAYFWKACTYYFAGDMGEARYWLSKSVMTHPSPKSVWRAMLLLAKTGLGLRLSSRLRLMVRQWRAWRTGRSSRATGGG